MLWESFHFLRPLWLTMIVPAILMFILLRQKLEYKSSWQQVIAPHLLAPLLETSTNTNKKHSLYLLLGAWLLASIALAGPTWEKIPIPVAKAQQPLVIVADMSMSMLATDSTPNRLARLKYKLLDLFKKRKEGFTALVVYAGTAHTVAPLTDDSRTLANLTQALNPDIMPSPGDNTPAGINMAINLIQQGTDQQRGHILLITDHVSGSATQKIISMLHNTDIMLSVIGIGTKQGAPITLPGKEGFLKDSRGNIVITQLEPNNLIALAKAGNGVYHGLTIDDADLNATLPRVTKHTDTIEVKRQFDQWHDMGYWLILLLLPFCLAAFRKGWITLVLLAVLYPQSQPSMALDWQTLWKNTDQRATEALQNGHPKEAAKLFDNPQWKAEALYQAKSYKEAANLFDTTGTAQELYNKANALARAEQFKDAITTYKEALDKLSIEKGDSGVLKKHIQFNQSLIEKLLKEQQKQKNKQEHDNKKEKEQGNNQQDKQGQDNNQQDKQGQNNNQQDKQGQDNNQQDKQGQNNNQQDKQGQDNNQQNKQGQDNNQQNKQGQDNNQQDKQGQDNNQQDKQGQDNNQQDKQRQANNQQNNMTPTNESLDTDQENQGNKQDSTTQSKEPQPKKEEQANTSSMTTADSKKQNMDQQALESWLRTIPDDPGGLLRRKFLKQREQEQNESQRQAWQ